MSEKPESYEAAVERLEEIIDRLDSGQAGLRETLDLCSEGRELVSYCAGRARRGRRGPEGAEARRAGREARRLEGLEPARPSAGQPRQRSSCALDGAGGNSPEPIARSPAVDARAGAISLGRATRLGSSGRSRKT